jgi:hypothetical protein
MKLPEKRIIEAVKRGDIGQIRRWARQGLRVTSSLPLVHATRLGKLAVMQCLVKEFGADVSQADCEGCTPLYFAARAGDLAMVPGPRV